MSCHRLSGTQGNLGYYDWEYQNRDPDYERTTPDGDVVVGVVTDFVRVFRQSNPILFGFGYGGSFFLGVLPQNPGFDIQGITNAVNDTLSKQACIDFYKRILNAASSKDNPLLRGGDLQQIFKDFLAQKNGGFTRTAPPGKRERMAARTTNYATAVQYRAWGTI